MEENKVNKENVSSFAFMIAKQIEYYINIEIATIKAENEILKAKILEWYSKSNDEAFKLFFDISDERI